MITLTSDRLAFAELRALKAVAAAWPVGAQVRHLAGWAGTITPDETGSLTGGRDAHCLLNRSDTGVVCVTWAYQGKPATAWFRPAVLTLVGADDVRPSSHRVRPRPQKGGSR